MERDVWGVGVMDRVWRAETRARQVTSGFALMYRMEIEEAVWAVLLWIAGAGPTPGDPLEQVYRLPNGARVPTRPPTFYDWGAGEEG